MGCALVALLSCDSLEELNLDENICLNEVPTIDFLHISNGMAYELVILDSLQEENYFFTEESIFSYYFKDSLLKDTIGLGYMPEAYLYEQQGFDLYVTSKEAQGVLTAKQKDILIQTKLECEQLLNQQPSLEQVTDYFLIKSLSINNDSTLCEAERFGLDMFFHSAIGFAEYYFSKYSVLFPNHTAQMRGCDFWEGLLCGFLSTVVGVVTAGTVYAILRLLCNIGNCDFQVSDGNQTGFLTPEEAVLIASLSAAIHVGIKFYKWCCDWFDDGVDVPECGCPPGFNPICPGNCTYDDCNCLRNGGCAPEGTHPFIWDNGFYFTALPGNNCPAPAQFYDGANCYLGSVPGGWNPFIYNNCYYVSRLCQ